MPLITALSFAAYIFAPSVFFVHDGDVKRRQSFVKLADSTYTTSRDRLDKLANEAEPDVNDRSFAREAIAWVVASRIGIAAALIFGAWTAIFASLGISVPAGSAASLRPKLLLRLVVPNTWLWRSHRCSACRMPACPPSSHGFIKSITSTRSR